jgi:hypothetical protein
MSELLVISKIHLADITKYADTEHHFSTYSVVFLTSAEMSQCACYIVLRTEEVFVGAFKHLLQKISMHTGVGLSSHFFYTRDLYCKGKRFQ